MADQPIKLTPLGNLDKDTDYNFIKEGNYVDALDVIKQDDTGNVSGTTQPTQRNKHAFSLGEVVAQNKKYRITVPIVSLTSASGQYAIEITSPQGDPMVDYNGPIDYPSVTSSTAVQFYSVANWQADGWNPPTGNINLFNVSYPTVNGVTVIEIELAAYDYYDYNIESVGGDFVRVEVIQEMISTDLVGSLKDIGSYDLLGDLFIFSTTQDNDISILDLNVADVGPVTTISGQQYYTGPVTTISFTTDHNFQEGQILLITNSNVSFLNGSFTVHSVISSNQIGIVTSTAWSGSGNTDYPVVTNIPGDEMITVNSIGIGEIGVAEKNEATNVWNYTRLLRSTQLNFYSSKQIDCHAHEDASGINLYYTDDYNSPRKFFFTGEYGEDYALNFISSDNIYFYDSIQSQSSLINNNASNIIIDLVSQDESGGVLISGNKFYFVRVTNYQNDTGFWSSASNPVLVYDGPSGSGSLSTGNASIETGKANNLILTGLNPLIDREIQVAVLEEIEGVFSGTIFFIGGVEGDTLEVSHSGLESYAETLDVAELISISQSYIPTKAKNIRSIDSRNVLSNVETLSAINLSKWTSSFKHSIKKDSINETTRWLFGEYKDISNVFSNRGFMFNEVYRIGCRATIKGLGKTDVFWVDDIKVDPNQINSVNSDDNRRVSNELDSYDLTEIRPNYEPYFSYYIPRILMGSVDNTDPSGHSFANPNDPGFENQCGVTWDDGWHRVNVNGEQYRGGVDFPEITFTTSIQSLIVPKISIEDINYDFYIDGVGLASSVVQSLEFFIADVPQSVKGSGIGVFSVNGFSPQGFDGTGTFGGVQPEGREGGQGPLIGGQNIEGQYLFEYPFATGSALTLPGGYIDSDEAARDARFYLTGNGEVTDERIDQPHVMVNYPIRRHDLTSSGTNPIWEFPEPRTDVISFYSGDSIFSDLENGADSLLVFGAAELAKNGMVRPWKGDWRWANSGPNPLPPMENLNEDKSNYVYSKSYGYFAKFQQRGTSNTYETYNIKKRIDIDPEKKPSPLDLNLTDFNTYAFSPAYLYDPVNLANAQTADDLYADIFTDFKFSKIITAIIPNVQTAPESVLERHPGGKEMNGLLFNAKGPVLHIDRPISFDHPNLCPSYHSNKEILRYSNRGVVACQVYKDNYSNFPSKSDTKYIDLGSTLITPTNSIISGSHLLGCGDTHTQNTYFKHRYDGINAEQIHANDPYYTTSYNQFRSGFSSGVAVVCQNRVNANMNTVPDVSQEPTEFPDFQGSLGLVRYFYPKAHTFPWVGAYGFESENLYDTSYDNYSFSLLPAYNDKSGAEGVKSDFPTRILWSQLKRQEGIQDEYRIFLPLDRKDLDRTFGEINHHEDINGELFTIQDRKFQLQYFNARGILETTDSSIEVLIGDGSVLARDGQTLSAYGTSHKWSAVKGTSQGGKDVVYWFNQENGLFMRFGSDGTVVLSERAALRSFSYNNTRWTENQYTPALNYGIRSVWDDRFKEAIWTFTGIRETSGDWTIGRKYNLGEIVIGTTTNNYPLDDIPDLYMCNESHNSTALSEPGNGERPARVWTAVTKDDKDFYTVFTLAFNELSNGFSTFYSHLPKTYLKWKNKFLSSNPLHRSELYEHRYGYDKWYEYEGVWKESEPFVEPVINYIPSQSKKFVAMQSLSENAPDKIELRTKDHESFLVASDFDPEDDAWRSPIKNDILTSSTLDPNDDTVSLLGSYMRVKFKFFNGAYNKLNNMIIKVRARLRKTSS